MDVGTLVSVLKTYDSSLATQELTSVLEDDDSSVLAEWAARHLTPDNLLTAEELLQYAALEKSGVTARLAGTLGSLTGDMFYEKDIAAAIEELNRSTEAIGKQTENLKLQQDALAKMIRNESGDAKARENLNLKRTQALELDRKTLDSTVADMSHAIELRLSELDPSGSDCLDNTQNTVTLLLASDDKLLTSLQKLGWELDTKEDAEEEELVSKLREVCARLIKHSVETCRTNLDRTYLESLEAATTTRPAQGRPVAHGEDMATVQEELESLYSEILSVSQMSVEQQYLAPALKSLSSRNSLRFTKSARAVEYMHNCLAYLLVRMEAFCDRLGDFHAHREASSQLTAIARSELAAAVQAHLNRDSPQTFRGSPIRRRGSSGTASSVPTRVEPMLRHRRRSSTSGHVGEESSLEQILQILALSQSEEDGADQALFNRSRIAAVTSALSDRTSKLSDVASNVQDSFEVNATAQIKDSTLAFQVLRGSLLAESPFGDIKLVDPEIDMSIQVLDQEMDNIRTRLEKMDSEMALIRGRRQKQDELIRRWGS